MIRSPIHVKGLSSNPDGSLQDDVSIYRPFLPKIPVLADWIEPPDATMRAESHQCSRLGSSPLGLVLAGCASGVVPALAYRGLVSALRPLSSEGVPDMPVLWASLYQLTLTVSCVATGAWIGERVASQLMFPLYYYLPGLQKSNVIAAAVLSAAATGVMAGWL